MNVISPNEKRSKIHVAHERYHPNKGNVDRISSASYFQEKLLSLTNFTITIQVIIKSLCKETKRR